MGNQNLFDKYSDGNHWENHPTIYADEFVNFFRSKSLKFTGFWTDLGCGDGHNTNRFNELKIPTIGVDNNPKMIWIAKKKYPEWAIDFHLYNIEELPFEDNLRNAYFCINVMHYVDQKKVLGEIYRTLKPGGYAFIHFNLLIIDENYSIDYHQKKSDIYELVKKFEVVEEKIFLREDSLPITHTHHIMQVILRKN